jgi:integrase
LIQNPPSIVRNSSKKKKSTISEVGVKAVRMSDVMDIFDGMVRIFRTTNSGDVWQMRMYVAEEQRYIRKSLKTRDKEIAIGIAQKEFIFYQAKILNGQKIFSITANELRNRYLESVEELVTSGQLSKGRQTNIKTFTKHFVDFVGKNTKIQNIDRKHFQGYRAFRQTKKKDITMTVVVNESITIKQMYRWAQNEGLMPQNYQLDFGKITVQKNEVRRKGYSIEEYNQIVKVAASWYMTVPKLHPKKDEEIYYRKSIRDFIVLMGNFGFRTGELLSLKYQNVSIHEDGTATVSILPENTKVRQAREVRGRRGDVFKRRKEYSKYCELSNYIFSYFDEDRVMSKDLLYGYYGDLIKEVKKKHKDFDDTKSLYSLRHFWITLHLLAGKIDVYKIARYAGTSLVQIQNHYDNVKDAQVSDQILAYDIRFDKNNEIVLEDDIYKIAL